LILDSLFRIKKEKVEVQQIDFLGLKLFRPWNFHERSWSWSAKLSYEGRSQVFAQDKNQLVAEAQVGMASLSYHSLLLSFLAGAYWRPGELNLNQPSGPKGQVLILIHK